MHCINYMYMLGSLQRGGSWDLIPPHQLPPKQSLIVNISYHSQ